MSIKLALVGYGYWGEKLMRCFSQAKGAEVLACCEPSEERHAEINSLYPDVKHLDRNLEATLSRDEVEAVALSTPAALHYEQAKAALLRGKHVFVEKPMALKSRQSEELVQIAREKNLTLFVGHVFVHNEAVKWAKAYIDSGELGEIYLVHMQRLALGKVRQDVDVLWNLAPHDLSILLYWLGESPECVSASGFSVLQEGIDDTSSLNVKFPSGCYAQVHVSWLNPVGVKSAVVVGSKQMLVFDDAKSSGKISVHAKGLDKRAFSPDSINQRIAELRHSAEVRTPEVEPREPLLLETQNFIDAISGRAKSLTDGESGHQVVKILEAASLSRKQGQVLPL